MIIKARNTLPLDSERTLLTHSEASGVTALRWKNPNAAAANWGIQIGETGEEQTEVRVLSSDTPAGTAGTITAATDYEHPADIALYFIKYDQVVFQKSASGTSGAATSITNGTITSQADSEFTIFDDTGGVSTDAYKTLFRSSGLSSNSTVSDFITTAGFPYYSLGKLRQRVRDKLWNADFIKEDQMVDDWINEWVQEMTMTAVDVNEDYSLGTSDVAFGTSGTPQIALGTITDTNFKKIRRLWVTYNGQDFFRAQKTENPVIHQNQIFNTTHPHYYMYGDNVFGIEPSDTGTARLVTYNSGTTLNSDTDELPVYMRGYTKSFVDYAFSQALFKDQKFQQANVKEGIARNQLEKFKKELVPRNQSGQTMIDVVESIGEEIVF